jgi:SAM-dependent methyltransferase|tara:strand:+ start:3331 stop:3984 length:654 start_codon:yes stop_codon:yes gene_type:complete
MAIPIQEEYSETIQRNGAIQFIGSNNRDQFDEMGQEHYDFLIEKGLQSNNVFLDVGCGAIRTGQHIIPFLNPNNYFGIDRMPELIEFGLNEVLDKEVIFHKGPKFSVNNNFDCSFVDKPIDIVWCQSLMSHLTEKDIKLCLNNVKETLAPRGKIYFTYFQKGGMSREDSRNQQTHSKKDLQYNQKVMDQIVNECGLQTEFNGRIGHPRGQWMYICKV